MVAGHSSVVVTNVVDIKKLPPSQAGAHQPVELTGVITYYDPAASLCYLQDGTGGILIQAGRDDRSLQAGQLCQVSGVTGLDQQTPCVESPLFTVFRSAELPKAALRSLSQVSKERSDGDWVCVQGVVRAVRESQGRLVYRLGAGEDRVDVVVNTLARGESRSTIGSVLLACGVAVHSEHRETGPGLQIYSPFERCLRLQAGEGLGALPIQTAQEILRLPPNKETRARLRVKQVKPGLWIKAEDATGELDLFTSQAVSLAPGTIIDTTGFVSERSGKKIIEDCSFRRVGFLREGSLSAAPNQLPRLQSAVEVRRLSSEEAARGYPVRLRGVITYYDRQWSMLFFQGASEGIFVKLEDQDLDIASGQLVVLQGVTGAGDFAPVIEKPIFEVLSTAPMPEAKAVSYAEMMTGVEDSQWVRTEGVITSISRDGSLVRFEVSPPAGNGSFPVILPRPQERTPSELLGARVEFEAACATMFNSRRELRGIQLFVPELRFIRVLAGPVGDPFASSPTPIVELFRFTPERRTNQLMHIRGVLTHLGAGRFHLQDTSSGILVLPDQDMTKLRLGQTLDLVGFPRRMNGLTILDKARFVSSSESLHLEPRIIRPSDALAEDSDLNAHWVQLDGWLIENGRSSDALTLLLEREDHLFNAIAPLSMADTVKNLRPGSTLRLRGVCALQKDEHGATLGFKILLRRTDDIQVLAEPSPWSVRHLVICGALLAFFTAAILFWVKTLRTRVRKQTAVIREHLEAQIFLQQRFVEFMKHFPGIAFMKNPQGEYSFANEAFLALLEKSEAEVLGRSDDDLWPPAIARRQRELDRDLLAGQGRLDVQDSFDPSGGRVWLTTRFVIDADRSGKRFACGIGVDITEQQSLEAKLRQAQKMECVGRLAGGVAHDFNNILQVISSYAELIQVAPHSHSTPEYAQEIFTAASRAVDLTRQLLMFSRKQVVKKGAIDINEVSRGMAKMLARIVGEDIALDLQLSAEPCCVHGDRGMLEQVLLNLAVNARDAMPRGGCLRIESSIQRFPPDHARGHSASLNGTYVSLTVADTGCGIKPEHLSNIFEPFFTTKEVGRGTGLGLATVYAIVQEHNGSISVDSKVGSGTRFQLLFPLVTASSPSAQPTFGRPRNSGGTETILLVEDDETVRKLSARILTQHGYRVIEAESGPAALDIARRKDMKLDLAITDMVMPGGLRGIELCEPLNEVFPSLPIIITSGYAFESAEKLKDLKRHTTFLQKPFLPEDLLNSVRAALCARA